MSIVWQSQYNKIILSENDRDTKRRIQMKKRVLSMLLVASMTGALLAGCGSGETASTDASADAAADTNTAAAGTETAADAAATDGEAVTLKWAIWDQETTPYWNALKEAYEAANPNVTIEMVDLGSTDYMTVSCNGVIRKRIGLRCGYDQGCTGLRNAGLRRTRWSPWMITSQMQELTSQTSTESQIR